MKSRSRPTRSQCRPTTSADTKPRKGTNARLEPSQYHSALIQSIADAVLVSRGMITWCNDKVEDVLGYTKDELIGKDASFFVTEDIASSQWTDVVHHLTTKQNVFSAVAKVRKKDGSLIDAEFRISRISGSEPPEFVTVVRDVTERRRAEEALQRARDELDLRVRERTTELAEANEELQAEIAERRHVEETLRHSEEHFRSLTRNALDVIVIITADGTIRFESNAIEKVLGYKPEEVVGQDGFSFAHPDDMPRMSAAFAELLRDPSSAVHAEVRALHRDGSVRVVEVVGQNLLHDPAVAGIVANFRDITERKMAEEARQKMEEQLSLSGRLAAVGELAAGVAHELNNPLSAIQAFAQFLASRKDLDETTRSDVETIYKEAQRATRITSNLLSFSRKHKPEKGFVSINEIVEKSLELHVYRMKVNNIIVEMELAPDLPHTMADFHQMQQVFANIITNAEQAITEAKGEGKLLIRTQKAGEMIEIAFTDDGPGITKDNLPRVFDPFFTTKAVGKGTGLGLGICYGIVQEHSGRLYARSKLGEGTTFVVELPIVPESQPDTGEASAIERGCPIAAQSSS